MSKRMRQSRYNKRMTLFQYMDRITFKMAEQETRKVAIAKGAGCWTNNALKYCELLE